MTDFGFSSIFANMTPDQVLLQIFLSVGWIPIAFAFLWGAKEIWVDYLAGKWGAQQKFILLAIDIPRGNDQSLKSVENMFTYLAGAHGSTNLMDTYWVGKFQLGFSFEIVSIDGYTQFLIRTPASFRNLVESAVYSVYPDAEISEVNDYAENVPDKYPDSEWDIAGGEFIPVKSEYFPFRTYPSFEDSNAPTETNFKDPIASLMDLNSSMRPGEQLWFQIIVIPTGFDWVAGADDEVAKILNEKTSKKTNFLDDIIDVFTTILSELWSILEQLWSSGSEAAAEEKQEPLKMIDLKPKQKKQVEAIQMKASKLGFECKLRMVYVARKEVMNKPKAISGFVGYIKQFIDQDLNNFKPDLDHTFTSTSYFFAKSRLIDRQNRLISAYKSRSGTVGRKKKIMNIEELATLWHFPIEAVVKAPLIQKASGRKADPPSSLPIETEGESQELSALSSIFEDESPSRDDLPKKTGKESIFEDEQDRAPERTREGLPAFFDDEEDDSSQSGQSNKSEERRTGEPPSNLPFA